MTRNAAVALPAARPTDRVLEELDQQLSTIRLDMLEAERRLKDRWMQVPERRWQSARNLIHYLTMRGRDLRPLQGRLAACGLSSLGRAESQALLSVETVLSVIRRLITPDTVSPGVPIPVSSGRQLLAEHTRALLGPPPGGRQVRIMVTMPSEAADDHRLVRDLVTSGMDCMRINTAHDNEAAWDRMLRHLERARKEVDRPCRVLMDIAGPKLRTGPLQETTPVVHWRPIRDRFGRVVQPARIWLTASDQVRPAPEPAAAVLPVSGQWLTRLTVGDRIKFFDARDSMRELAVTGRAGDGVWAEAHQSAYVLPATTLHLARASAQSTTTVGDLPLSVEALRLKEGDTLVLTRDLAPGTPAVYNDHGELIRPATIALTLPEVLDDIRSGEPIWFDDGSIGGVVRAVESNRVEVTITRTRPGGGRLSSDKGVNLPETDLKLPALTAADREALRFIDGRADLVGYSFVRTDADVQELQAQLATISLRELGIVLKIETRRAFENLPSLLLAAMSSPSSGVMIARGDLAVECGYERLAEVQEQILWMAEASHTPVIWATQVLETLARDGVPSRAEITDAAMAERAECVMLNKGPYIVDAVRALDDILVRMQAHQDKKSAMLRELALAHRFLDPA
jgi:pyruvate kinase